MYDKRSTGGDRQKPRDPGDKALRKLFVGNMNAATNRATMQSYFDIEQGPQGTGAFKSFQEQEHPVSIRRTHPSQSEDAPDTNRQRTQNHVGWKASRIQASAGTKIKYGEGGTQSKL